MAQLEKLSNTCWKQPFRDRKKEFHLWNSHSDVADYCNLEDGTKRLLQIHFPKQPEIDVTDWFQITSGREISFPKEFQNLVRPVVLSNPESFFVVKVADVLSGEEDKGRPSSIATSALATVETRVGQAHFRGALIQYWKGRCAVTGISLVTILKASHIKPWAVATDEERMDEYNGLLLSPTPDALFDRGILTFSDQGNIIFSTEADGHVSELGINKDTKIPIEINHVRYLKYHREHVSKAN